MNYHTLHTKPLPNITHNITEKMIIKSLLNCYKNTAFSTFPYILHNVSSREAINKYKSGNCIALSMYVQQHLLNRYNVKSYLIPATIPNKYKYPEYLDISHVALAIPKNNNEIYIVDSAFYFLNPIKINFNTNNIPTVYSKNVYKYEPATDLQNYVSIDKIETKLIKTTNKEVLNEYQSIPENTFKCICNHVNDKKDTWTYILREVLNPDRAITTFFINTRKKPFICSTMLDKNGICTSNIYLKLLSNNLIETNNNSNPNVVYNNDNIPNDIKEKLKKFNINNLPTNIEQKTYIIND